MHLRLRHKFTGLAVVSALLPVLALLILFGTQERRISSLVLTQLENQNRESLALAVRELMDVLQTADDILKQKVNADLTVARHFFDEAGAVSYGPETAEWQAVNQDTRAAETVHLPMMKLGGRPLGQDRSFDVPSLVVDEVTKLVGGTCTIFQRINDAGDMLRVATTVANDGQRATGTFLPADTRVVQTVLAGDTFRGPAFVVNAWYLTAYEPIKDTTGRVTGMLYVGTPVASEVARALISRQDFKENNFAWIALGENRRSLPPFVFYGPDPQALPAANDAVRDTKGVPVFPAIVAAAVAKPGEVVIRDADWRDARDPNDPVYFPKSVACVYYKPWDWVVGIIAYDMNFMPARTAVSRVFKEVQWQAAGGALVFLLAVGLLATYLGGRLASPITYLTGIARHVADGDLARARELIGSASACPEARAATDETGQLYQAIAAMIGNLQALLGRVHTSSDRLRAGAATLAGATTEQESLVQDFGASSAQIAAAVREISATAQELASTMNGVSALATQTAAAANAGRTQLDAITASGATLNRATAAIAQRLTAIAEKARNINAVVTAITKVADQTNLLSLNAAIEAEKAGEYGLGFAVVAREIRRLADQTAEATLDIEQMVREMQGAVSAGVMEMDKFSETVRTGAERSAEVAGHLGSIIQQVEDLTPRLASVREGMAAQSQGAQQINEGVETLNTAAQRTDAALVNLKSATRTLDGAVASLQEGVAHFRLEAAPGEPPPLETPPPAAPVAPAPAPRRPGTLAPFALRPGGTPPLFPPRPRQ